MTRGDTLLLVTVGLALAWFLVRPDTIRQAAPADPGSGSSLIHPVPPGHTVRVFAAEVDGCAACAASRKAALSEHPRVVQAEVDAELDQVVVVVPEDVAEPELRELARRRFCWDHLR